MAMNQLTMSEKSQGLGPHGASSLLTSPHGLRRSHDQPAMRAVPVCQHYWYTPCLLICSFYRSCCALYLSKNQTSSPDGTGDLARATFSLKIRPLLFLRWRIELTLINSENVRQWRWGFKTVLLICGRLHSTAGHAMLLPGAATWPCISRCVRVPGNRPWVKQLSLV